MRTITETTDNKTTQGGFTLVEMAMVILILGLMVAMFSQAYSLYRKNRAILLTEQSISVTSNAIGDFRALHGRYPCPASITAERDDLSYGREDCDAGDFGNDFSAIAPGGCNGAAGVCVRESVRTVTYRDPFTENMVTQKARVRMGGVPFRNLNIPEENIYDGYDNRLFYIVTEHLAFSDSYTVDTGGIEVINNAGLSALSEPGSAHYIIISTGENQLGALTHNGKVALSCPTGPEGLNCALQGQPSAIYTNLDRSDIDSFPSFMFDDTVEIYTPKELTPWMLSEEDGHQYDTVLRVPIQDIGVNTSRNTALDQELIITGTVRLRDDPGSIDNVEGTLKSEEICEQGNPDNCFRSALIAGTPYIIEVFGGGPGSFVGGIVIGSGGGLISGVGIGGGPGGGGPGGGASKKVNVGGGLWCPNGTFMTAIEDGSPICQADIKQTCPEGHFMIGADSDGNVICNTPPPPPCPSTTVDICSETDTLPVAPDGATHTVHGGYNASQEYICSAGTWVPNGPMQGQCTCTPYNEPSEWVTCKDVDLVPCGYKFSGEKEIQIQYTCPVGGPPQTETVTLTNNCVCENTQKNGTGNCPSGYNEGIITNVNKHLCDVSPPQCSGYITTGNTCACVPKSETQLINCPQYYTGQYKEQNDFVCDQPPKDPGTGPTGAWTGWHDVPGETQAEKCVCVDGQDLSAATYSCQAGWSLAQPPIGPFGPEYSVGNIKFPRHVSCTAGGPVVITDWANPTSTCEIPPPPVCTWKESGAPVTSTPTKSAGELCPCGTAWPAICNVGSTAYVCECKP